MFGQGRSRARILLVGEQPGDVEDRLGEPFVGPSGRLLRELLARAGVDLGQAYLTNAVKHFKWVPRGKRRLHSRPRSGEIWACRPWLDAELAAVEASIVVCLGAVAVESLLGPSVTLTSLLGKTLPFGGRRLVATYHPSAALRAPTEQARREVRDRLLADLRRAWRMADEP